jgi:hypothetical protein
MAVVLLSHLYSATTSVRVSQTTGHRSIVVLARPVLTILRERASTVRISMNVSPKMVAVTYIMRTVTIPSVHAPVPVIPAIVETASLVITSTNVKPTRMRVRRYPFVRISFQPFRLQCSSIAAAVRPATPVPDLVRTAVRILMSVRSEMVAVPSLRWWTVQTPLVIVPVRRAQPVTPAVDGASVKSLTSARTRISRTAIVIH